MADDEWCLVQKHKKRKVSADTNEAQPKISSNWLSLKDEVRGFIFIDFLFASDSSEIRCRDSAEGNKEEEEAKVARPNE
jgi:hypothetical protein